VMVAVLENAGFQRGLPLGAPAKRVGGLGVSPRFLFPPFLEEGGQGDGEIDA